MYDYHTGMTYPATDVMINDYSGNTAEVVAERPSIGNNATNLTNFGSIFVKNAYANGQGMDNWSPAGGPDEHGRHGFHMNDGSQEMAYPTNISW